MSVRPLSLGRFQAAGSSPPAAALALPPHHLVTHGVVVGMTGSGKTGLVMVLVEEALRSGVPVLMVDVKGDLPNLLLAFDELAGRQFEPWMDPTAASRVGKTVSEVAEDTADRWRKGLGGWGLGPADVASLRAAMAPRIITPGSTAGEPLHVLSSIEAPGAAWDDDEESAREALSAAVSLLLRLVGRDADPARSKEHVLLAHFAERRLRARHPAGLAELLGDLQNPPIGTVGALAVDDFMPPKQRLELAQELNALLASPSFSTWRQGIPLDVGSWLAPKDGRAPAVIVSVAHLDDTERLLVLGLLFEQLLSWVRGLHGTSELRALVVFDEVFGFLPPHPQNPPTKRPLLGLLKQARAFGVGVVLATQNTMDLDYKALSNAGTWFVGRLQTDADRERIVEGLGGSDAGAGGLGREELSAILKSLPPRAFFLRDVHMSPPTGLLETRWTLSWLRGPLTRREITRLVRPAGAPAAAAVPAMPAAGAPQLRGVAAFALAPAPGAAPAAPVAMFVAPPLASAPVAAPAAILPEGWKQYFAHAPAPNGARFRYVPWVAGSIVVHVRDAKLGISHSRRLLLAAPLGDDGRLDVTRAGELDRALLAAAPDPSGVLSPLSEMLRRKANVQAAERALRDQAYRACEVAVDVHRELGLVREEHEAPQAFAARCREAAVRRVSAAEQEAQASFAPKLAKLRERFATAQAKVPSAEALAASGPGTVGTVLIGMVAGRGTARKLESDQRRAATKLDKAKRDLEEAAADLRELTTALETQIATLRASVDQAASAIETRKLAPKKGDVEVVEMAVAWAAVAEPA